MDKNGVNKLSGIVILFFVILGLLLLNISSQKRNLLDYKISLSEKQVKEGITSTLNLEIKNNFGLDLVVTNVSYELLGKSNYKETVSVQRKLKPNEKWSHSLTIETKSLPFGNYTLDVSVKYLISSEERIAHLTLPLQIIR